MFNLCTRSGREYHHDQGIKQPILGEGPPVGTAARHSSLWCRVAPAAAL